ncbi:MAG: hypothetical protein HXX15_09315 [Rhodopseudomonas sp.]|nr:hypothetical protein [Rhodopseudomonas sp.]NVN86272.1 hypothetical protein [Rhodopseudomonas sp.]
MRELSAESRLGMARPVPGRLAEGIRLVAIAAAFALIAAVTFGTLSTHPF